MNHATARARTPRRYDLTASQALHLALVAALALLAVFALGAAAGTGVLGAAALHFGGLVVAVVLVGPFVVRTLARSLARAVAA